MHRLAPSRAATRPTALAPFGAAASLLMLLAPGVIPVGGSQRSLALAPASGSSGVSPDAHLTITFAERPAVGTAGEVRIYEAADDQLVDRIDLSHAPGPLVYPAQPEEGAWSARRPIEPDREAPRDVIGGFTEGFRYYPIIVRDRVATVYPRHGVLTYGRRYYVEVDPGVLTADGFAGLSGRSAWTFETRQTPPVVRDTVTVAADGSGDFTTIQGAIDAVPNAPTGRVTIAVAPGLYEEIVYFRGKRDITILGADRTTTVIGYANNEVLNGPPPDVRTSELPGTFPYGRAAFMADGSTGIHLLNLTVRNFTPAGGSQAEAILLSGGRQILSHVTASSHQDTLQVNDAVYVEDSLIEGDTDFLWGRGPAFFTRTTLRERAMGPFMWVRSTAASHGFVFVDCRFEAQPTDDGLPLLARNTASYPDSEVVLIDARLAGINPMAWELPADTARMNYVEFNSRGLDDGLPVDVRSRHPGSRQLDATRDAATIADFRTPSYVLNGWTPELAPVLLAPVAPVTTAVGRGVTLRVEVAAVPAARYEWRRDGVPLRDTDRIRGAGTATLQITRVRPDDAGTYTVTATNSAGRAASGARLTVR